MTSDTNSPVEYHIETLDGGISVMRITGTIDKLDFALSTALSNLSKKFDHVLIDLSNLVCNDKDLFSLLSDLSARTKIKVIATKPEIKTPCSDHDLSIYPTERSAVLSYAGDETLKMLLSKLRDVPILNTEAYQLISFISQPDVNLQDVEAKIKNNPGLCSQIIRVANSAFFRRSSKSETLQQSLMKLGVLTLRQLFIYNFYNSTANLFKSQENVIDHGRKCAKLAEYICRSAGSGGDECAKIRLAGLLHDIGSQALAFFFPAQYEKVHALIKESGSPSYMAELIVFGTEHQKVGSLLCKKWNFPDYMSGVIADHHFLQAGDWNTLTLPIFIANNFLNELSGIPFVDWYQKLEGYFFLKKKDMPWKDVKAEFEQYLSEGTDPF